MIIKGNLKIYKSSTINLGNIEKIYGYLEADDSLNLISLGKLKYVKSFVNLNGCKSLKDFGKLIKCGLHLDLGNCDNLKSLKNLKIVKGYLILPKQIEDLGELEEVGTLRAEYCSNLKTLGKLKKIKYSGFIYLNHSGVTKECVLKEKPFLYDYCQWENKG